MSKEEANKLIGYIRAEDNPGKNTKTRVADAIQETLDSIPNPASGIKSSDVDYVTEKTWSDKNKEFVKYGDNDRGVTIGGMK